MYYTPKGSEIDATRYPDLRKWVVGCLSSHKKPNDIIFEICRRTGWDWSQAKQFVGQVIELDQKQVHQKRMPLLVGIGVFILIIPGAVAFISGFIDLIAVISTIELPLDLQKIFDAVLMARSAFVMLGKVFGGLVMFLGGSYGVISAVKSAMTGEGEDLLKPQTPNQA